MANGHGLPGGVDSERARGGGQGAVYPAAARDLADAAPGLDVVDGQLLSAGERDAVVD